MTIIEKERWSVRMHSGAVHVIDPLALVEIEEDADAASRYALGKQIEPIFDETAGGFVIVDAYDRIDSRYAKTRTILFLAHVESMTILSVQMDADE
jgi:hypothetical protein